MRALICRRARASAALPELATERKGLGATGAGADTGPMNAQPARPSISVVIPVKDDAELLERCLGALRAQTDRPDEVVVVDNGSVDATREVAARGGAVCVTERRPGIPAASAAGYDAATGDVIARLDADSVPPDDWVARVREAFAADAGLAALTGPGEFTSLPRPLARAAHVAYMRSYFALFRALLRRPPLFGSNFAIRREAWRAARGRTHRDDPNVHDDLDLSFALSPDARVAVRDELRVAISARPFAQPLGFLRRVWLGVRTVVVNRRRIPLVRARAR